MRSSAATLQRALGVEARHDDDAAAVVQQRRGQAVEPAGVEHGHEVERRVARRQLDRQVRRQRVEDELAVRHQHALGAAGRARAVHEDDRILEVDLERRRWRVGAGGEQLLVGAAAGGRLVVGHAMRDRGDHAAGELGAGAVVEQHLRLRVGDDAVELGGGETPVERREDGAQLGAGEERLEVLAAVVRQHGDAVALAHAERARQRARQTVGAAVEVPVAPAPRRQRLEERRRFGRAARPVGCPVAEVVHRSPLVGGARLRARDLARRDRELRCFLCACTTNRGRRLCSCIIFVQPVGDGGPQPLVRGAAGRQADVAARHAHRLLRRGRRQRLQRHRRRRRRDVVAVGDDVEQRAAHAAQIDARAVEDELAAGERIAAIELHPVDEGAAGEGDRVFQPGLHGEKEAEEVVIFDLAVEVDELRRQADRVEHLERRLQDVRRNVAVGAGELGRIEARRATPQRQEALVVQRHRRGHGDERRGGQTAGGDGHERERAAHAVAEDVQLLRARALGHDGGGARQLLERVVGERARGVGGASRAPVEEPHVVAALEETPRRRCARRADRARTDD